MKITSIVGLQPQFIESAALSGKLREPHEEFLVRTWRHYDCEMSGIFLSGERAEYANWRG